MRNSFLDYLLDSRSDSTDSLQALRGSVQRMREPIGTLARRQGLLDDAGITRILEQQQQDGRPFGELAACMGLLAVPQIQALLQLQRLVEAVRVAELLASSGHLSLGEAVERLDQFFLDAGLQDRIAYLDRALHSAEERASELSGRLAGLNGVERDLEKLFEEVEHRRVEVREAKRVVGELERALRGATVARDEALEEREQFRQRFESREEDLLAARRVVEEAKQTVAAERKRLAEAEERFGAERIRTAAKLDDAARAEKNARREAETASRRAEQLERARDSAREELTQVERELAARDLRLRALEGELKAERESSDQSNGASVAGTKKIAELERRLVRREASAENARKSVEEAQAKLKALEAELESERASVAKLEEKLERAQESLSREQRARADADAQLEVARKVERSTQRYADKLEESAAQAKKLERSTQRYADKLERELAVARKVERSTQKYTDRLEQQLEAERAKNRRGVRNR